MIFLSQPKPDRLVNLCVLNCDLTERLFYCAWALSRIYTAKAINGHARCKNVGESLRVNTTRDERQAVPVFSFHHTTRATLSY
jgi:hypothetical protein